MSFSALLSHLTVYGFIGLLVWAAWSDVRSYLIPNRLSLAIAGLFAAYAFINLGPADAALAVAVGLAAFAFGFGAFAAGLVGGGDVKLLAATALWAGPAHAVDFLIVTTVAGGFLAVGYWLAGRMRAAPAATNAEAGAATAAAQKIVLPYGVAIAAGGVHLALTILAA